MLRILRTATFDQLLKQLPTRWEAAFGAGPRQTASWEDTDRRILAGVGRHAEYSVFVTRRINAARPAKQRLFGLDWPPTCWPSHHRPIPAFPVHTATNREVPTRREG